MKMEEALKIIRTYEYYNGTESITGMVCTNNNYIEACEKLSEAEKTIQNYFDKLEELEKKNKDLKEKYEDLMSTHFGVFEICDVISNIER